MKVVSKKVVAFIITVFLFSMFLVSCTQCQDFDRRINLVIKPYRFSITAWELKVLIEEEQQPVVVGATDEQLVKEYFALVKYIDTLEKKIAVDEYSKKGGDLDSLEAELKRLVDRQMGLTYQVSKIITAQIEDILVEIGIFHPWYSCVGGQFGFPPVNFRMESLPHLLVISPRDRIESMREFTLNPGISIDKIEEIETAVDKLDVSSLVVDLGGFGGTYPTMVSNSASLQFTINAAIEEWLHQYLIFRPLGFRYLLDLTGISRDYEIAVINETLASMVSKEIGNIVYKKYYSDYECVNNQKWVAGIDLNHEMRKIRRQVDHLLAMGEVDKAEIFMETNRQYLVSMGFNIRKLNQAYFAFYGTYADREDSISPIGLELRELREHTSSIVCFLDTVADMTSHQDLRDIIRN